MSCIVRKLGSVGPGSEKVMVCVDAVIFTAECSFDLQDRLTIVSASSLLKSA